MYVYVPKVSSPLDTLSLNYIACLFSKEIKAWFFFQIPSKSWEVVYILRTKAYSGKTSVE